MDALDALRVILSAPTNRSAWTDDQHRLVRDPRFFLSVDFGQEPEETLDAWRRIVGDAHAAELVIGDGPNGHTETLHYKGARAETPLTYDRVDSMLTVITLAKLVWPDFEIRLARYTIGDSTLTFVPLPPAQWAALEREIGPDAVRIAFAPAPASLAELDDLLANPPL